MGRCVCVTPNVSDRDKNGQDGEALMTTKGIDPEKARKMMRDRRKRELNLILMKHLEGANKIFIDTMILNGINRVSDDDHEQ